MSLRPPVRIAVAALLFACHAVLADEAQTTSAYSPLTGARCQLQKTSSESADSVQECPGVGGYRLQVIDADSRMSIALIAPDGKALPLRFWDVVTRYFSTLGAKAEWRLTQRKGHSEPVALIVRVKANEDPDSDRQTEYLVVSRLNLSSACVIARIPAKAGANQYARDVADRAETAACLPDRP